MKHQIIVRYSNRADRSLPLTLHLRKCIAAALEAEHVNVPVSYTHLTLPTICSV